MSAERGLLEDVLAHPQEDSPRLIYADWCEENGDPARAELIRVQIELARLPRWDGRRLALEGREKALLERHTERWCERLPGWGEEGREGQHLHVPARLPRGGVDERGRLPA
jgi:uncharacterized protein (TIGR02996 family)